MTRRARGLERGRPRKALRGGIPKSILTDFSANVGDSRQMLTKTRKWLQERGRDTPTKGLLWITRLETDHQPAPFNRQGTLRGLPLSGSWPALGGGALDRRARGFGGWRKPPLLTNQKHKGTGTPGFSHLTGKNPARFRGQLCNSRRESAVPIPESRVEALGFEFVA